MDDFHDIFDKANEHYKDREYDKALELYEQCIRISDDKIMSTHSMQNMGVTYLKMGKYDNAIKCFKKVINVKDYPKISYSYYNLGYCYICMDETYLGYKAFLKSYKIDPTDADAFKALNFIKSEMLDKLLIRSDLKNEEFES